MLAGRNCWDCRLFVTLPTSSPFYSQITEHSTHAYESSASIVSKEFCVFLRHWKMNRAVSPHFHIIVLLWYIRMFIIFKMYWVSQLSLLVMNHLRYISSYCSSFKIKLFRIIWRHCKFNTRYPKWSMKATSRVMLFVFIDRSLSRCSDVNSHLETAIPKVRWVRAG